MHNHVKMLRSTELYAFKKWILSCFLKFKNKSKYNGKDCSAECSLLATKGRLRVGIPAVLSSKNPIHQLIKAKRFFKRWEGGREDVISKLQAELSPHTQCIQILSSFHLPYSHFSRLVITSLTRTNLVAAFWFISYSHSFPAVCSLHSSYFLPENVYQITSLSCSNPSMTSWHSDFTLRSTRPSSGRALWPRWPHLPPLQP